MSKKALLAGILPFISNPVVLAVLGVSAIGLTVYEMLSDKEEEQENGSEAVSDGSSPFIEPLEHEEVTVPATVVEPLETVEATVEETVHPAVEEPYAINKFDSGNTVSQQGETISEEDLKKEVIRQAMSELGKRSAAARAKKKNVF